MGHRAVCFGLSTLYVLAQASAYPAEPDRGDGTTPAAAGGTVTVSPVFHQLVAFTLPAHFKVASDRANGGFYIREHILEAESVNKWSKMITLTAVRDLAANPSATPQGMLESMMRHFRQNCPETYSSALLGSQQVEGYDAFQAIASCGHQQSGADAYSQTAVMLAVKGSADYYTFQWSERGTDSKRPPTLDTAYWTRQFAQLLPIRLCPIVPGEAPPYRSCAGR